MATEYSFDIVSKADPQEVKNAVGQAQREIETRFDFRGSISEIEHDDKDKLTLHSDDEARLTALIDVLQSKLIKRGVDIKFLEYGKLEQASKGTAPAGRHHQERPADRDGQEDHQADQRQGAEGDRRRSRTSRCGSRPKARTICSRSWRCLKVRTWTCRSSSRTTDSLPLK